MNDMQTNRHLSRRGFLIGAGSAALLAAGNAATHIEPLVAEDSPASDIESFRLTGKPDEGYWTRLREQFTLEPGMTFMNNGAYGPTSRFVTDARRQMDLEMARDPRDNFRTAELDEVRQRLATFINAEKDEIALTYATTDGVNIFAVGLDWKAGDEVIIGQHEHFDPVAAYDGLEQRYGIKIVRVQTPSPPQSEDEVVSVYEKAITPRTRVIFVSHVTFITGLRTPIKQLTELAHRHGALISVDSVQSTGALRIDVKATGVDHFASGGQKWMLGGTGTGFTYIRKDLQPGIWPRNGYVADETGRNATARRYENTGQRNIPAYVGLATAAELLSAIGTANVEERVLQLAGRLRQGLSEIPRVKLWTSTKPELAAGLTTFGVGSLEPKDIMTAMEEVKIFGRPVNETDVKGVRVSTHIYNSPDEIDRLLEVVRKVASGAA